MLTALKLIEAMQNENKPLSELCAIMTVFPQVLINVEVNTKPEIETVPEIMTAIRSAEAKLGEKGRVWFATPARNRCAGSWWKGRPTVKLDGFARK